MAQFLLITTLLTIAGLLATGVMGRFASGRHPESPEPRGGGWVGAVEDDEGSATKDSPISSQPLSPAWLGGVENGKDGKNVSDGMDRSHSSHISHSSHSIPRSHARAVLRSRSFTVLHRSRATTRPAVPAASNEPPCKSLILKQTYLQLHGDARA